MATIIVSDWDSFITAVGTTGADVEFPHDSTYLVKTNDIDVNPNKLYLDSNGIVQTNVQPSDLPNLYENTFVLDANDDNDLQTGFTTTITVNCNSINGYGGYIKNIYSDSVEIFTIAHRATIKNIAFLNFSISGCSLMHQTSRVDFQYCLFQGQIENYDDNVSLDIFRSSNNLYYEFTSCSFNLTYVGNRIFFCSNEVASGYSAKLTYCRIDFDTALITGIASVNEQYITPINTYITGNCANTTITIKGRYDDRARNSIFEISENPTLNYYNANVTATNMLINNELYTGSIPTGFSGVSSTDLTNAQTLRDTYGFPIQT